MNHTLRLNSQKSNFFFLRERLKQCGTHSKGTIFLKRRYAALSSILFGKGMAGCGDKRLFNRESPRINANRIFLAPSCSAPAYRLRRIAPERKENAIRVNSRRFAVGSFSWIHTISYTKSKKNNWGVERFIPQKNRYEKMRGRPDRADQRSAVQLRWPSAR